MKQASNLKLIRMKRGKTQLQIHMATGINQSMLSKYERGATAIPSDVLVTLTRYYHTNPSYLLGLTDDDSPNLK